MSRFVSSSVRNAIDVVVLTIAYWLAFLLRFETSLPYMMLKRAMFTWPYVVAFQYGMLVLFDVPRLAWRYVGLRDVRQILVALGSASAVLLAVRFVSGAVWESWGYAQYVLIPKGVIAIDFALALLGIVGVRAVRRMVAEREESRSHRVSSLELVPTVLIGAGSAGVLVAKEIGNRPDLGILPIGFLDDDPRKVGTVIHGLAVLGRTDEIAAIRAKHGARQALISIASAPGKDIRRITRLCEEAGLPAKIIPGIFEIVSGRVNLSRIRNVTIEDLLGREPVVLDDAAIARVVRRRIVLITGAGGSIGSELCRQVMRFGPSKLVLVEQAENNLFQIHRDLVETFADREVVPCVGDVCDEKRMRSVFERHRPDVVFHAAAHKHVPMMEWNPGEAIKNNVLGTKVLADLAHAFKTSQFVMISTDKAVNPTSVMGASKRVAEIYIQALSQRSRTRFVTVRFGNVLGSVGSVIPIFKEQIAKGGPVTVTHPEMKRYFMTIPEACQLVLEAGAMGQGGEIFILDMGEPMKIVDLARDLVRLSGLRPDVDIEIRFTGVRPGEKLFEELSVADENADKTRHPKIFVGRMKPADFADIAARIEALRAVCDGAEPDEVRRELARALAEYKPAPVEPAPAPASAPAGAASEPASAPEKAPDAARPMAAPS